MIKIQKAPQCLHRLISLKLKALAAQKTFLFHEKLHSLQNLMFAPHLHEKETALYFFFFRKNMKEAPKASITKKLSGQKKAHLKDLGQVTSLPDSKHGLEPGFPMFHASALIARILGSFSSKIKEVHPRLKGHLYTWSGDGGGCFT